MPDETTILNFRHLLERHDTGQIGLLDEINAHLESQGLRLREGTIVDASIIEAPSSTKNSGTGSRDPEIRIRRRRRITRRASSGMKAVTSEWIARNRDQCT